MSFDSTSIPDGDSLSKAAALDVYDSDGVKVNFGALFEKEKVVVVFVRHFFCGVCQLYVENLAKVPEEALSKAGTRIVVVGCGEWSPIKFYQETTGFKGPIYADPSRALYRALGMTLETLARQPADVPRPSYLSTTSVVQNLFTSIGKIVRNPFLLGKQGNFSQLGGDYVFGPGLRCSFTSRMKNTEDHVPVVDLMKAAGVEYTE
ncbi:hypothetical protein FA15DRAFT_708771 [Coprinopsis marcescibilis]|uniref:Uncharacterized protein n=1 Tax=Coprinopsis marcescibilis TaxID=230819 RepID=A0A5C3KHS1_COPMA|nr:hypothetical protein FA15DRAFT_708771 [Coprinopsis marcescibilis]